MKKIIGLNKAKKFNFQVKNGGIEMERKKIESFDNLKHGDKIISPIDNEVTEFYINKDGEKYLTGKKSLFSIIHAN